MPVCFSTAAHGAGALLAATKESGQTNHAPLIPSLPRSRLPNRVHRKFPARPRQIPLLPHRSRLPPGRAPNTTPAARDLPSQPAPGSSRVRSGPVSQRYLAEHFARGGRRAWGRRGRMYARRASQLLKELDACEPGQLVVFNSDVFDQVIRECGEHNAQFQALIRKMVEQNLDIETTRNEDHYGAAIHHLSLLRNKRCLMAYMYNRAETIRSFRWKIGPVLPHEIQEKLNFSEKEYFRSHSSAIKSYISEMDIDLTVDMVPPKDPYIQVRVLEDIGEVSLGDHSVSLTKNSLHFLRRTDAEQFISQGLMEEFLE